MNTDRLKYMACIYKVKFPSWDSTKVLKWKAFETNEAAYHWLEETSKEFNSTKAYGIGKALYEMVYESIE